MKRYSEAMQQYQATDDSPNILFCGHLNYGPNVDGVCWFVERVWPAIREKLPTAKLILVGKSPNERIKEFSKLENVSLFSNVESVLPYYANATITIVPLHVAGGTRIKIMESFACKKPVVSTTIGAEGLDIQGDVDYLIADTEVEFAGRCIDLLSSKSLRENLAAHAYRNVLNNYDTDSVMKIIRKSFESI